MVHIDGLFFNYAGKQQLFDQLDLELPPGNIYGLLGKNGAGKSTLLKIMAGLLFPKQGRVEVAGAEPKARTPEFLSEVYLVMEEFILPPMSIERYVKLHSPFYPRFNHEQFEQYMGEFGLPGKQKLSSFSYGQKKKFLLSFGLATDCELLILDEPTNGLDVPSKSLFRKVVAGAIHEERSFIISTHQVRDMEKLIDPIIILDEGEVALFQSFEQVTEKLKVSKKAELPTSDTVVYYEEMLGGYKVVEENTNGEETNMDLETLFNTVVNNGKKIHEIFKN